MGCDVIDAGVNVNPHPGTRWGLVGKRRGFDRNSIPEGVGDWEIFVFNRLQGKGFGWGSVMSRLLRSQRLFISKINSCAFPFNKLTPVFHASVLLLIMNFSSIGRTNTIFNNLRNIVNSIFFIFFHYFFLSLLLLLFYFVTIPVK